MSLKNRHRRVYVSKLTGEPKDRLMAMIVERIRSKQPSVPYIRGNELIWKSY